jgi:hypothetical protein
MGSFKADLWKSFNRVQGTLLSVLSLLLAIASFFYTPAAEIRFNWKWAFVALPICAAVCATLSICLSMHGGTRASDCRGRAT